MNLCFIIGKIISEIKYDFIIGSKNISIVRFNLKILEGSIINVIGYDNIADFCYRKLSVGDNIFLEGILNTKGNIEINKIEIEKRKKKNKKISLRKI